MSFDLMTLPETTLHYRLILGTSDQPTFIFENGYGQDLSTWQPIMDQVEGLGTILMYDRTNIGGSMQHDSETSRQSVNRLRRLIDTLSLKPPFILVGHSYGGTLVRQFASQYPSEIKGLLLIDATPESYIQRFLPVMPNTFQAIYKTNSRSNVHTKILKRVLKRRTSMSSIPFQSLFCLLVKRIIIRVRRNYCGTNCNDKLLHSRSKGC